MFVSGDDIGIFSFCFLTKDSLERQGLTKTIQDLNKVWNSHGYQKMAEALHKQQARFYGSDDYTEAWIGMLKRLEQMTVEYDSTTGGE